MTELSGDGEARKSIGPGAILLGVLVVLGGLVAVPVYAEHRRAQRDAAAQAKLAYIIRRGAADAAERAERIRDVDRMGPDTAEVRARDAKIEADAASAERAYITACTACASAEACERDRLTIIRGQGSATYSPCD